METASVSSREVDAAEREARKAREGATRLEAEVKRLSTHLAGLNSSYRSMHSKSCVVLCGHTSRCTLVAHSFAGSEVPCSPTGPTLLLLILANIAFSFPPAACAMRLS